MKHPKKCISLLAVSFGLALSSAYGTLYDYTYFFGDGLLVTGQLSGDQNGSFIDNVTDVSVFFNGIAIPGTVFTASFDGASYQTGPVVSFDALQNNFLFSNSDLANGDFGYDSIFYILNASVYFDTAVAFSTLGYASQDDPTADTWRLEEHVPGTHVPDSSGSIAWLGLGLAGLVWLRGTHNKIDQVS